MQGIKLGFTIMLVVAGIVAVPRISGQVCNGNLGTIQEECEEYYKPGGPTIPPSTECCNALRNVDVPCMCRLANNFQSYFSGGKVVYTLRQCGKDVPPGTTCGGYRAPPASTQV
ncbi:hypothetical protein GLYMA_14G018900v4 [Glycine max]|uniref:Bifunctional inhibitor/plant lipid transfer protein/seed storage helical domain-containing protein n=1 Tax=Glycine max TaxID=3847 RepID=I1M6M7_SOYBN|nr:uncharacterized protein LOC100814205 [Glycine max]KAG4961877.1 hypothetical protein JHK86_038745 [Glycine max]KAG5120628.1 hypothetical protein JHK84_038968 [Glycine max]KAH1092709.1 hypothetical protein GYH30_038762 [Glycine max]KRH14321.1 hypothetical protein GLYMA_14G018900v4 [Glycine max]|eukprot:XP_003544762.1 uncharacterized protein LOC100814205 [Glycine max]